jgi:hypothetical protein
VSGQVQQVSQKLYEAAAAEDAAAGESGEAPDDDEVVDAEIVEDDAEGDEA